MNSTTILTQASTNQSSIDAGTLQLIGIFINLALNLLMMFERVLTRVKTSECMVGPTGTSVKVDNSKEAV